MQTNYCSAVDCKWEENGICIKEVLNHSKVDKIPLLVFCIDFTPMSILEKQKTRTNFV